MPSLIDPIIAWAAGQPRIFNFVRRVLEGDFLVEKLVIRTELLAQAGPRRVLDMGCGTGYFAPMFDPRNYVGVDLSRRFVEHARRTHPGHAFVHGDVRALSFPDAVFDDALCLGLLHHLKDDDVRRVMRQVRRVLRPGGRVLVMEDARHDEAVDHDHSFEPLAHWGVHLFQWADVGDHIRPGPEYAQLFGPGLEITKNFAVHSGVCYYHAYLLRRTD